jgi:hypothetical protein
VWWLPSVILVTWEAAPEKTSQDHISTTATKKKKCTWQRVSVTPVMVKSTKWEDCGPGLPGQKDWACGSVEYCLASAKP